MRNMWLLFKLSFSAVTARSTRGFYDRISPFYESLFTEHLARVHNTVAVLKESVSEKHRTKVLDVACGTGILSRELQDQGFSTTGLDFSFQSLRRLMQKSNSISVVQADAASLPFASASFDVVTCMGAWRHFLNPQGVLKEICRVLRDNGLFVVGYFPPKLGGLVSVPNGSLGKATVGAYRSIIHVLKYDDSIDQENERETLTLIELAFAKYRILESGTNEHLIFADSPRRTTNI